MLYDYDINIALMNYTHLTQIERYQIYVLKKAGHTQMEIASNLGRSVSTISRELRRNRGGRGYRPKQAHQLAVDRRAMNARTIPESKWEYIRSKLNLDWSPEQISHFVGVSIETIYKYIYTDKSNGGQLWKHLRCQKKRRKRYGKNERRGSIIGRKTIDHRPAIVEQRSRVGDWEADTIIGKGHKQAILSIVERKSGFTLLRKVSYKTAAKVSNAIIELLKPFKGKVHTITSDNGKEFADHQVVSKELEVDFYFAHPYASWERGTNENTNGLVRQYFPKGQSFKYITDQQIEKVMELLNNRPRKRNGFKTPAQMFFNQRVALHTRI